MLKAIPFLLAASLCGTDLSAQAPTPDRLADSSVERILTLTRNPEVLAAILRQQDQPVPGRKLDSLADGLSDRAIRSSGDQQASGPEYVRALTLGGALPAEGRKGVPYRGAVARLILIHRSANADGMTRASALRALAEVEGFVDAIPYIRSVATTRDPLALDAMQALVAAATPNVIAGMRGGYSQEAVDVLATLWKGFAPSLTGEGPDGSAGNAAARARETIPDDYTRMVLYRFAVRKGWTNPDRHD